MSLFARVRPTSSSRLTSLISRRSYARMTIIGNLGATPEVTTLSNGKEVVRYVVASNFGSRENPKTSWFRIALYEPKDATREYLTNLRRGTLMHVEADAALGSYQDEATGKSHTALNLIQKNMSVLRRAHAAEGEEQASGVEEAQQ
ncbi:MAG: hypothetical protein Q9160_006948 [Pyrenula sp. 1 TL-2023]